MTNKFSTKIEKHSKIVVFILLIEVFCYSCGKNKLEEKLLSPQDFKIKRPSFQKSGTRFYKEDTFNFNYLIEIPSYSKDSSSSDNYQGNVFLILPRRN